MEVMSGMLEGGNRDKDDNLIGTLSNRKQAMGDVAICDEKCRQVKRIVQPFKLNKNRVIE